MRWGALLVLWGAAACREPKPAPARLAALQAVDAGSSTAAWDERDAALARSLARLDALTPKKEPAPASPPDPSGAAGGEQPPSVEVPAAPFAAPALSVEAALPASAVANAEPGGAPARAQGCPPAPLDAALGALRRLRTEDPAAVPACVTGAVKRTHDSLAQLADSEGANVEALVSISVPEGKSSLAQCALATAWAKRRFEAADSSGGERALRLAFAADGRCPEGFLLRVERAFAENQLAEAREQAERGAARNPGDGRFRGWLTRLAHEGRAEAGATVKRSAHFALSVDGELRPEVAEETLATLEEAAPRVNALYGYTPSDVVSVVLYGSQTFNGMRHVSWAAGYYDGKVRMPAGGAPGQTLMFKEVLLHEYGHAVTSRAAGGAMVPAWFNEGLAQRASLLASGNGHPSCAQGHDRGLGDMVDRGFGTDTRLIQLAYVTALHAADRFVERFGAAAVQQVLQQTASTRNFAKAFERVTRESPDAFIDAFDLERQQPR